MVSKLNEDLVISARAKLKGELFARPFRKPVSHAFEGHERLDDAFAIGFNSVKTGMVTEPVMVKPETGNDDSQFEWGKPLLGGLSDAGEDNGVKNEVMFRKVSIPFQRPVRDENPDEEVVQDYIDEQGRRVTIISKITTTRRVAREERRDPSFELAVDVPTETSEELVEYSDEYGRSVRRVFRSSVSSSSTNALSRDGPVKVVLQHRSHYQKVQSERPEDQEGIETFTSDKGHRTQKLKKTTFRTQLKGSKQDTELNEKGVSSPIVPVGRDEEEKMEVVEEKEDDKVASEDQDESDDFQEKIVVLELKRYPQFPKWLDISSEEAGKQKELQSVAYPKKTSPVDPEIKKSPEVREDISCTYVIRKVAIPELSSSFDDVDECYKFPTISPGYEVREPYSDVFKPLDSVNEQHDSEEVIPSVKLRDCLLPAWMVKPEVTPQKTKQPNESSWLILRYQPQHREPKEELNRENVKEICTPVTLNRDVVRPKISGMEEVMQEKLGECDSRNSPFPLPQLKECFLQDGEEYDGTGGVKKKTLKSTIASTNAIPAIIADEKDELQIICFESAFPVYLDADTEETVPLVQTTKNAFPEGFLKVELTPPETKQPEEDISWLTTPNEHQPPQSKEDYDCQDLKENATSMTSNRVVIPEIDKMEDNLPEEAEAFTEEYVVAVQRIIKDTFTARTVNTEGEETEPVTVTFPITQTQFDFPVEEYIDYNEVLVRRTIDDKKEAQQLEVLESTTPICLENGCVEDVSSLQCQQVMLPKWISEAKQNEAKQPEQKLSFLILPSQPLDLETKEDLGREIVIESFSATNVNREVVIPELSEVDDESPAEEFDDHGVQMVGTVDQTQNVSSDDNDVGILLRSAAGLETKVLESAAPVYLLTYYDNFQPSSETRDVLVAEDMVKTEEVGPDEEGGTSCTEATTLEPVTPEAVLVARKTTLSPEQASIPYETMVVQPYFIIMETLRQLVIEQRSLTFIYSSRYMQFNFVLENFLDWMIVTMRKLSLMKPVSWKVEEIQSQLREIKVFTRSVFAFA